MGITVTFKEMNALIKAKLRRHGIGFTYLQPPPFKKRVTHALRAFILSTIYEPWIKLLIISNLIEPIIDVIIAGLSVMFRDSMLKYLSEKNKIGIWYTECFGKEWVYNMNIVLYEINLAHKIQSLATGINEGFYLTIGFYDSLVFLRDKKEFHFFDQKTKPFREIG